ncbi:hypothetical protein RM553_09515 [Zunongwangia sp. F363]|uniref:Uncharacterized protein n=1 Tax=Autumnicola tepida TaxID=3075595 RepID=A0ABU3C9R8_9FLAO|nr:hypothetical protein [Zunongwangia sp. F363]MDT0643064.1 hypothetical protein [Zunongwangia sp. F363]
MKKASAILLLFIFSFNSVGFYIAFGVQLYQIKQEVRQKIIDGTPEEELVQLKYSSATKKEFHWHEDGEFSYKGKLYDVVRAEKKHAATIYYCIVDKEETILLASLKKQLEKNSRRNKRNGKPAKSLNKVFFQPRNLPDALAMHSSEENNLSNFQYFNFYKPPGLEPSGPPPKRI